MTDEMIVSNSRIDERSRCTLEFHEQRSSKEHVKDNLMHASSEDVASASLTCTTTKAQRKAELQKCCLLGEPLE